MDTSVPVPVPVLHGIPRSLQPLLTAQQQLFTPGAARAQQARLAQAELGSLRNPLGAKRHGRGRSCWDGKIHGKCGTFLLEIHEKYMGNVWTNPWWTWKYADGGFEMIEIFWIHGADQPSMK